jgi:hypothetical protein
VREAVRANVAELKKAVQDFQQTDQGIKDDAASLTQIIDQTAASAAPAPVSAQTTTGAPNSETDAPTQAISTGHM